MMIMIICSIVDIKDLYKLWINFEKEIHFRVLFAPHKNQFSSQ